MRPRLGTTHVLFLALAAAAPLTVVASGVPTTYAVTGVTGLPLAFLLVAAAVGLFAVGYTAMGRRLAGGGTLADHLGRGLGRTWAVAGSFVALLSYNAIQIGLYGLFGAGLADFADGAFGVTAPWWVWAAAALVAVTLLGVGRIDHSAWLLGALVLAQCLVVALYVVAALYLSALSEPGAAGYAGVEPGRLFVPGVAVVLAFTVAGFVGLETAGVYRAESRSASAPGRAMVAAVLVLGVLGAVSAWAVSVSVGPDNLQRVSADFGSGLIFFSLGQQYGPVMADTATVLALASVFAALVSFHHCVIRYPSGLGRRRSALAQSTLALVVLATVVLAGADPVLQVFTWGSALAVLGVVALMAATSAAVVGFFRARPDDDATSWQRMVAPALAAVVLTGFVLLLVGNVDALVGAEPGAPPTWILPALVPLAGLAGAAWAAVYPRIGRAKAAS